MRRACLIALIVLILTGCLNVSLLVSVTSPFAADATPTREALPTPTPIVYYGTVVPDSTLANVRGCKIVSDALCPVVMKLRPGDTPLKVVDTSDPEWLKVEIPGIGLAWVVRYVVTFHPS